MSPMIGKRIARCEGIALFVLAASFIVLSPACADTPHAVSKPATAASKTPASQNQSQQTSQQQVDAQYTTQIRQYTTEPYLITPLVDHLPASATVPSPDKVLGYIIGTPNKLTHTADIYRYYRALEKASPRVRVFTTGKSEEGRDFIIVAVSDDANIAQLDHYRDITAKLADPRKITPDEAAQL
ncbi:MAG: hypothetical protein ACREDR_24215 [Blastocatellia bacterium]